MVVSENLFFQIRRLQNFGLLDEIICHELPKWGYFLEDIDEAINQLDEESGVYMEEEIIPNYKCKELENNKVFNNPSIL